MSRPSPEDIDKLLPQTQCGLCGYGGCLPYAEAITFEQAPINLCPPGGVKTLKQLARLVGDDPTPYIDEMAAKAKPTVIAAIREHECIGCTKCIQVCPVDAILGSAKKMHTVIENECTGCELCIPACPVDCIDLISSDPRENREQYRTRFTNRNERLQQLTREKNLIKQKESQTTKLDYIAQALARVKAKKK